MGRMLFGDVASMPIAVFGHFFVKRPRKLPASNKGDHHPEQTACTSRYQASGPGCFTWLIRWGRLELLVEAIDTPRRCQVPGPSESTAVDASGYNANPTDKPASPAQPSPGGHNSKGMRSSSPGTSLPRSRRSERRCQFPCQPLPIALRLANGGMRHFAHPIGLPAPENLSGTPVDHRVCHFSAPVSIHLQHARVSSRNSFVLYFPAVLPPTMPEPEVRLWWWAKPLLAPRALPNRCFF